MITAIDSQQVVYMNLKKFIERMTNHLKIPKVLSWKFLETDGMIRLSPEISLSCQKNFVGVTRRFRKVLVKLILEYDIILIPGIYQNIPE